MVEPIEVSLLQFACYLAHDHYNKEKTSEIAEMRKTNQGSKWIRKSTRLAIYYRDGLCCVYCGAAGERSQCAQQRARGSAGDSVGGFLIAVDR